MKEGMSVRKAAKYVGISKNTSFAWRHKFLSSLSNLPISTEQNTVAGATLFKLPYSDKGRKKQPESQNLPTTSALIVTETNIWLQKIKHSNRSTDIAQKITQSLKGGHIAICPDKLLTRAIKHQVSAKIISSNYKKDFFTSLATEAKMRVSKWMDRFRGVASKYLQNYWSWFVSLERCSRIYNGEEDFERSCISMPSLSKYRVLKEK